MILAVEFFSAKDGSQSAKANGLSLHSAYNPKSEAERFAQNLEADFIPSCVVLIEGALGYCAPCIRKRFPNAKVGVIRFSNDFSGSDRLFDFSLPLESRAALSERLFDILGEENLFQCLFFEWPPSAKIWPEQTKEAWLQIKAAMEKAKSVLATREYFGKRWIKNKILFFTKIRRAAAIEKISRPVLICASGPSLEDAIPSIKKNREKLFVCALSSSIGVLERFKIEPDVCMSADGGYWAKKHLEILEKDFLKSPLILSSESACPSPLFEKKFIVPLCYDDDVLSKKIFDSLGIKYLPGKRNGTVSGSALDLFLEISCGPIFFCGLDLQSGPKNNHARPNALDNESDSKDFRLRPKALRAAKGSLKNPSLEIYADWFSNKSLGGKKVYRIKGAEGFKRSLGQIKDISVEDFARELQGAKDEKEKPAYSMETSELAADGERRKIVKKIFFERAKSENFREELFPADSILERRASGQEEKDKRKKIMEEKTKKLFSELFKGEDYGSVL